MSKHALPTFSSASSTPCTRCGRGGNHCFICGRTEKQIPDNEILVRNEGGGICEPCVKLMLHRIENKQKQLNQGGHHVQPR